LGLRTQPLLLIFWRLRPWMLGMNRTSLRLSFLILVTGSSVEWTEESSDEDLDYFAALDVAAAEVHRVLRMLKLCLVRVLGVGGEGRLRSVE
jgi:hypothetical protein